MLKRYYFYIDFERRKSKNNFLNRQIVFITFILMSVYLTLPKFQTLAKFEMKKRCVGRGSRIRKGTKKFGSRSGGILVKKGCKEGGVSL